MREKSFRLAVVLSAAQQTGGAYYQSLTNLKAVLRELQDFCHISVIDAKGSFSQDLDFLVKDGVLMPQQRIQLPAYLGSFRDRVICDSRVVYRFLRRILFLWGKDVAASKLARFLDTSDFDLIYFVSPAPEAAELQVKPYIWTLWDLCHLDSPEFPEVRTSGKFEAREEFIRLALRKSAFVIVDSPDLADSATLSFGIPRTKFIEIPFDVPHHFSNSVNKTQLPPNLRNIAGRYFFYPAQLWTHKNHLRIVEALEILNERGYEFHVVFVGKDHGAGNSIKSRLAASPIFDRIHFLGFVDDEVMTVLYKNSVALVMASYFGPTNIPPIEAIHCETPVIASNVHKNQLQTAALYFNPDDAIELAERLLEVTKASVRKNLLANGKKRRKEIEGRRSKGELELVQAIRSLEKRLLR